MKKLIYSLLLLVAGLVVFAACGGNNQSGGNAPELAGRWELVDIPSVAITFNQDGTGNRNWNGAEVFEWHNADADLYVNLVSGFEDARDRLLAQGLDMILNEEWTFEITKDTLSLTSRQDPDMNVLRFNKAQ